MIQTNILDLISQQYSSLTRSGKKLADFILANKYDTQYLSISSLAEACNVSEATITRFCRGMGLAGYNDFKLAIAKADRSMDTGILTNTGRNITDDDTFEAVCQKLCQTEIDALNETLALIDKQSAMKAADLLSNASRIFCFGQGGSNVMAMEAWARFSTASSHFIHIADSHMQAMASSLCTEEDVILFFSYSGATKDILDVLKPAKDGRAKIVLVTHFSNSPASALADVALLCGSNESPLQSGSIAAKIAQMFVIDYLYHLYCQKNPDTSAQARTATAHAIACKLL